MVAEIMRFERTDKIYISICMKIFQFVSLDVSLSISVLEFEFLSFNVRTFAFEFEHPISNLIIPI